MAECVSGSGLSVVDGTLRFDPSSRAPRLLLDHKAAPRHYSFSHTSRPSETIVSSESWNIPVPDDPAYILATLDVGESSVGTTSRNGIMCQVLSHCYLTPTEVSTEHGGELLTWWFGTRYDAGTDFIWRNQGVVETNVPQMQVDVPVIATSGGDNSFGAVTGTVDDPNANFIHTGITIWYGPIDWNSGGADHGSNPLNYLNTPDVRLRIWAFPVVA